jgi:hypothetical protein
LKPIFELAGAVEKINETILVGVNRSAQTHMGRNGSAAPNEWIRHQQFRKVNCPLEEIETSCIQM